MAEVFLEYANRIAVRHDREFGPGVLDALVTHPWPGNVRELKRTIERACILAPPEHDVLTIEDLGLPRVVLVRRAVSPDAAAVPAPPAGSSQRQRWHQTAREVAAALCSQDEEARESARRFMLWFEPRVYGHVHEQMGRPSLAKLAELWEKPTTNAMGQQITRWVEEMRDSSIARGLDEDQFRRFLEDEVPAFFREKVRTRWLEARAAGNGVSEPPEPPETSGEREG